MASIPSERWVVKAAEWNPELSSKYRTNRIIGRPRRRWEDDINEFLKLGENETENFISSTKHGIKQQKTVEDGLYSKTTTQRLQKNDKKVMRELEAILKADQRDTSME